MKVAHFETELEFGAAAVGANVGVVVVAGGGKRHVRTEGLRQFQLAAAAVAIAIIVAPEVPDVALER